MADREKVQVSIEAIDNFSKVFDNLNKRLSQLEKRQGKVDPKTVGNVNTDMAKLESQLDKLEASNIVKMTGEQLKREIDAAIKQAKDLIKKADSALKNLSKSTVNKGKNFNTAKKDLIEFGSEDVVKGLRKNKDLVMKANVSIDSDSISRTIKETQQKLNSKPLKQKVELSIDDKKISGYYDRIKSSYDSHRRQSKKYNDWKNAPEPAPLYKVPEGKLSVSDRKRLMGYLEHNSPYDEMFKAMYRHNHGSGGAAQFSGASLFDDQYQRNRPANKSPRWQFSTSRGREYYQPFWAGLSTNYPDNISASFTHGMDAITLRSPNVKKGSNALTEKDVQKMIDDLLKNVVRDMNPTKGPAPLVGNIKDLNSRINDYRKMLKGNNLDSDEREYYTKQKRQAQLDRIGMKLAERGRLLDDVLSMDKFSSLLSQSSKIPVRLDISHTNDDVRKIQDSVNKKPIQQKVKLVTQDETKNSGSAVKRSTSKASTFEDMHNKIKDGVDAKGVEIKPTINSEAVSSVGREIARLVKQELKNIDLDLSGSKLKLFVDGKFINKSLQEALSKLNDKVFRIKIGKDEKFFMKNIKDNVKKVSEMNLTVPLNAKMNSKDLKTAISKVDNKKAVDININLKNILTKIKNIESKLKALSNKKYIINADINTNNIESKLIRLATYINQFNSKEIKIKVDNGIESIVKLSTYMNQLKSKNMSLGIDANISKAKSGIMAVYKMITELVSKKYKINIDIDNIVNKGSQLRSIADALKSVASTLTRIKSKSVKIDFNTGGRNGIGTFIRSLRNLERLLQTVKNKVDISISVNDNGSIQKLREISNLLRQIRRNSRIVINTRTRGGGGGYQSGDGTYSGELGNFFTGFMRFIGRSSKGFGSFGEAIAQVENNMIAMGGTIGKVGVALSIITSGVAGLTTSLYLVGQSAQSLGNILIQIGTAIYNALKPGIELYKQQQSAIFSFTAALQSGGVLPDGNRLSDMGNSGRNIARGISTQLIEQATFDAEVSAFSLEEILRALQGVMPMLMQLGMSAQQAYEVTKGVAGVAKFTQLAPNQVLQEARDLAQGSITARTSQVANALGITNEDLAQYKGNADALFEYLMGKFKEYSELLNEFEDTAIGRWQQLQDRWANVTKNIVEGIAPQFKGLFESIIEATGRWEDKNGNYFDAIKGEWHNAKGEFLATIEDIKKQGYDAFKIDFASKKFIPSELFEDIKDALVEIVDYVAQTADYLVQWVSETYNVKDPIEVAKTIIEDIVDLFASSVLILGYMIDKLIEWKDVFIITAKVIVGVLLTLTTIPLALKVIYDLGALIVDVFSGWMFRLKDIAKLVQSIVDAFGRLASGDLSGAFDTLNSAMEKHVESWISGVKSDFEELGKSWTALGKVSYELMSGESFTDIEKILSENMKANGIFTEAINRSRFQVQNRGNSEGYDASNVRGIPKSSTDKEAEKARKQAIKDSQKALKEHIKGLKETLQDNLDKLKELQKERDIAYKEGFTSIKDYFTQKADLEAEEARLRLQEAQEELAALKSAQFENEYDRLKELHGVQREISKYSRQVEKTTKQQQEVSRNLGIFISQQNKLASLYANMMSKGNIFQQQGALNIPSNISKSYAKMSEFGEGEAELAKLAVDLTNKAKTKGMDIDVGKLLGLFFAETTTSAGRGTSANWRINKNPAGFTANSHTPDSMVDWGGGRGPGEGGNYERYTESAYDDVLEHVTNTWLKWYAKDLSPNISTAQMNSNLVGRYHTSQEDRTSVYDAGVEYAKSNNLYNATSGGSIAAQASATGKEISDNIGNLIAYSAYDYVKSGVPYVWGGTSKSGVDCSGLVYSIYRSLGIDIERQADYQARQMKNKGGFFEDAAKLMVGDLVFMRGSDPGVEGVGHVGIYTGDGKFAHAAGSGQNVKYTNLSERNDIVGYGSVRVLTGQMDQINSAVGNLDTSINKILEDRAVSLTSLYDSINTMANNAGVYDLDIANLTDLGHDVLEAGKQYNSEIVNLLAENTSSLIGNMQGSMLKLLVELNNDLSKHRSGSQEDILYTRLRIDKFRNDVLTLRRNTIDQIFEFREKELELGAEASNIDLYTGRTSIQALSRKLSDYLYNENNPYGIAGSIKEMEKLISEYTKAGFWSEAQKIREKLINARKSVVSMFDNWIEQGKKYFDNAEAIFNALPNFTPTQREFAEREFNAYRAQREYDARTELSSQLNSQYQAQIKYYKELVEQQKSLTKGSKEYLENQRNVTIALQDSKRTEALMAENEQMKKLADIQRKMPDYFEDIKKSARDALDNGLTEFLTNGIFEAESLGDALKDLAYNVLKEIHAMTVKWMVKGLMNQLFGRFDISENMPYAGQLSTINQTLVTGFNGVINAVNSVGASSGFQGKNLFSDTSLLPSPAKDYKQKWESEYFGSRFGGVFSKEKEVDPKLGFFGYGSLDDAKSAQQGAFGQEVQLSGEAFNQQVSQAANDFSSQVSTSTDSSNQLINVFESAVNTFSSAVDTFNNIISSIGTQNTNPITGSLDGTTPITGSTAIGSGKEAVGMVSKGSSPEKNSYNITTTSKSELSPIGAFLGSAVQTIFGGSPIAQIVNGLGTLAKRAFGGGPAYKTTVTKSVTNPAEGVGTSDSLNLTKVANEISSVTGEKYDLSGGTTDSELSGELYQDLQILVQQLTATLQSANEILNQVLEILKNFGNKVQEITQSLGNGSNPLGSMLMPQIGTGTAYATGGKIVGAGTSTSDSIPAMLSNGEYVINAASAKKYGNVLDAINNGTYNPFRYATGGYVGDEQQTFLGRAINGVDLSFLSTPLQYIVNIYYLVAVISTYVQRMYDSTSNVPSQDSSVTGSETASSDEPVYGNEEDLGASSGLVVVIEVLRMIDAKMGAVVSAISAIAEKMGITTNEDGTLNTNMPTKQSSLDSYKSYREERAASNKSSVKKGLVASLFGFGDIFSAFESYKFLSGDGGERIIDNLGDDVSAADKIIIDLLQTIAETVTMMLQQMTEEKIQRSLLGLSSLFGGFAKGGVVYQNNGLVSGPGTSTSDSIPAMLSNGEAVLNAEAVRALGTNFVNSVNNGNFSKIRANIPKFADGGIMGDAYQDTARGMTDFAKTIGTNVTTNNQMNIALVRDEREAMEHFMRSPKGERILVDFARKSGSIYSTFGRRF